MQCAMCDGCAVRQVNGVCWNAETERSQQLSGDLLCQVCFDNLKDYLADYFPRPGFSKPARFIVARTKSKSVVGNSAVTLAICFGNWCKAAEIKDEVKKNSTKRFLVTYIKHKNTSKMTTFAENTVKSAVKVDKFLTNDEVKSIDAAHAYYVTSPRKQCDRCKQVFTMTSKGTLRKHSCI